MNNYQIKLFAQVTANMEILRHTMQLLADSLVASEMENILSKLTDYQRKCFDAVAASEAGVGKTQAEIYILTKARHASDERFTQSEDDMPSLIEEDDVPDLVEMDDRISIAMEEIHMPRPIIYSAKSPALVSKRSYYNHPLWPSPRPRNFAKECQALHYPDKIRFTHETAIKFLADHAKITVEEFLAMNPAIYRTRFINGEQKTYLYKQMYW